MQGPFEINWEEFIVMNQSQIEKSELNSIPQSLADSDFIDLIDESQDNESVFEENNWKSIFDSEHRNQLLQQNSYLIKNTLLTKHQSKVTLFNKHSFYLDEIVFNSKNIELPQKALP